MLRLLGLATLIMVAICLVLGASIALAVDRAVPGAYSTIEAVDSGISVSQFDKPL